MNQWDMTANQSDASKFAAPKNTTIDWMPPRYPLSLFEASAKDAINFHTQIAILQDIWEKYKFQLHTFIYTLYIVVL